MPTNIQIDFSDVSAFAKEIKSFNTSLTTLEKNTARFATSINAFSTNFGQSNQIFKELKENIKGVDTIFRGIASAMTGIAKIPNLDTQIGEFNKFVDGIKRLDASGTATVKNITGITNAFNGLARLQAKGSGFNLQPIVASIQELIRITSGATNLAEISANLMSFAKGLKELQKIDPKKLTAIGSAIAQGLKSSEAIEGAEEFGHKIADAIIKATKDGLGISSPSTIFIQIGGFVASGLAIGILAKTPQVTKAASGLVSAITSPFKAVKSFFSGLGGGGGQQTQGALLNVGNLQQLISAIGTLPTLAPADVKNFQAVIKSIVSILDTFKTIPTRRFSLDPIRNLFGQSSRLTNILEGIRPLAKLLNSVVKSLSIDPQIATAFKKFFDTLFGIINFFKNFPFPDRHDFDTVLNIFGRSTRFTKFLQGLKPLTKLIASALSNFNSVKIPPNALRAIATNLRSIVDVVTLFKTIDFPDRHDFDTALNFFGRSTRLTKFLQGIRPLTKLLASALGSFKNLPPEGNLRSVRAVLEGLVDIISLFSDEKKLPSANKLDKALGLIGRSTRLTQFFRGIKPLTKLIAESINEFKKIKVDPRALVGVSLYLNSLGNLLNSIAKNNINPKNAKLVADSIKIVSDSLREGIDVQSNGKGFEDAGENVIKSFFKGVFSEAEISSPSKKMMRVAADIYNGFKAGISKVFGPLKALGSAFIKAFVGAFTFVKDAFTKLFGGVLTNLRQFGQQVTQSFSTIISNLRNTAKGLVTGGLATIGTGGFASFLTGNLVTLTASFDQVITTIGVFGKITGDTLSQVQDDILKFSAVTKFGPAESAQAFLDLQKAGLGVAESLKTLPAVGAFATAGQIDLANATTLALTSMNGFGLGIEDINEVIDTFVGGADISTAGVTELANALGFVAPSANALSISIQDTTAALALLNDQAISGERAGTGLRAVLDALAAPTDEAKKTLQSLGITLTDNEGNFVGLSSTISQFSVAIQELRDSGAGDVEIIEQLSSLGDRNAISTLLALIKEGEGTMTEFADGTTRASTAFDDYRKNLENANKAQDIAAELAATVQAKIESLKGSIQVLIISAFQPLLKENIAPIIDGLIAFFNRLAKLPKPILKFGAALVAVTAILTTLAGAVSVFAGLLLFSVIPALQLAGTVFTLFFNPVTILATGAAIISTFIIATPVILAFGAAITFVGGILYKLYSDIKNNTGGARDSFNALGASLGLLKDTFVGLFDSTLDFFNAFMTGSDNISGAVDRLNSSGGVSGFLDTIREGVDKITASMAELKLLFDFFTSQTLTADNRDTGVQTINDLTSERIALQDELNQKILESGDIFRENKNAQEDYLIKSGDTLTAISRAFDVTIADILKANPEITDPNLIFAGATIKIPGLDTSAPSEDVKELQGEIAELDAEITKQAEDQLLRIAKGQAGVIETQEEALSNLQARSLALFKESNLFKRLFGEDDQAVFRAVNTVGKLEDIFKGISKSISTVSKGFNTIFSGKFKNGIKQITAGFSGIAFQATNLFETITGVDISDELQKNLSEGNLRAIFNSAVTIIGNGIKNLFISATPFIIQGAGFVLSTFLKSFGAGLRFAGNLLGIDFVNSFFTGLDANVIAPIVSKFIETLSNLFQLGQGDITLSKFIIDLFGLDTLGDKVGVVLGIEDIKDAIDELKKSFSEFLTESGLNQINFRNIADDLVYFQKNVLPQIIIDGLHGIAGALRLVADALIILGPIVRLYVDSIGRLFKSIQLAAENTDSEKLKDIGYGLLVLSPAIIAFGSAVGLISIPAILATGATILLIAGAFLALYIAFNILSATIDPILDFLQDLGDFAQDISRGDFRAALGEVREMFGDLGEIIKGAGIGSIDAFIGLLEAVGKITGIDLSSAVLFFNAAKQLLLSDKSLGELLNIDFNSIFLEIQIQFAILKVGLSSLIYGIQSSLTTVINGIIDVINALPLGDDVEKMTIGVDANTAEAQAELDKLNNQKITIEANLDLKEGVLSEGAVDTINSGDKGAFGGLIKSFFENGFSDENIRAALADASQSGAISTKPLIDGLLSSVATGDITPEQAANLIPSNLFSAFQTALKNEINVGSSDPTVISLLDTLSAELTDEIATRNTGAVAAGNIVTGFSEGIATNTSIAIETIKTTFGAIKSAIAAVLETNSPSLYTAREGLYLVQGLQQGIQQNLFLAFEAVGQLTSTLDGLKIGVMEVQNIIVSAFSIAAVAMEMNVQIMQGAIERLILSLYGLNYAAATTLGTLGAVITASGGSAGGATTVPSTSSSVPPPTTAGGKRPPPNIPPPPGVQGFGATTSLAETLKRTMGTRNVGRGASGNSGGGEVVINYGGITINNTNPNHKMTPDDIAKGIRLHEEQNPPSRKMRNRL